YIAEAAEETGHEAHGTGDFSLAGRYGMFTFSVEFREAMMLHVEGHIFICFIKGKEARHWIQEQFIFMFNLHFCFVSIILEDLHHLAARALDVRYQIHLVIQKSQLVSIFLGCGHLSGTVIR
ncbi:hypothetical protein ACJX0J_018690, partial [Zea mays]